MMNNWVPGPGLRASEAQADPGPAVKKLRGWWERQVGKQQLWHGWRKMVSQPYRAHTVKRKPCGMRGSGWNPGPGCPSWELQRRPLLRDAVRWVRNTRTSLPSSSGRQREEEVLSEPRGMGHQEKAGASWALKQECCPGWIRRGRNTLIFPSPSLQSLARSSTWLHPGAVSWLPGLGAAAFRGHPLQRWRRAVGDLGPDRPGTGSGRHENGMAMFGLGSRRTLCRWQNVGRLEGFYSPRRMWLKDIPGRRATWTEDGSWKPQARLVASSLSSEWLNWLLWSFPCIFLEPPKPLS